MSLGWIILIIALVIGLIAGNILLLRANKKFNVPPDYEPRKYDDDNEDKW
ncbi:DUF2897 family protein [Salinimonas sp. HHU 13199]|uniref:DUF2897 family protein n=1 Tax=Salinimonas profundi TaxID=2729140 RepID=A0ABR8LF95_9ALTE|nr:DUF2897 family protein [Salinimonas profundi]MBD3584927.1 DUF2897 family protein [Salinimonas profundi]